MSVSRCRTTLFPAVELGGQVRNVFCLKKTWVSLSTQVRPVICRSRAIVLVVIAFKLNKPHKSACFFLLVPQNKDTFVNPAPLLTLLLIAQPQTSISPLCLCFSVSFSATSCDSCQRNWWTVHRESPLAYCVLSLLWITLFAILHLVSSRIASVLMSVNKYW